MKYLPIVARICLALIFLKASISHTWEFGETQQMMAEKGIPLSTLLLIGTIVLQLLGGVLLTVGYQVRIAAILLIIFLIPATLVFHDFWANPGEINNFFKNIGLVGGLLMVIYADGSMGRMNFRRRKSATAE